MPKKFPRLLLILSGALLVLNILQASLTELIYDEAYYWYFSQQLAWGYFDHPPMVALLIKISSFLFAGELGVRFMSTLLGVATYFLIWALVDRPQENRKIGVLFAVLFAMPLLNAYGFLTLPDTPLLFFTALFLYTYKKFLKKKSVLVAVALGLTMAALMYSKYHAVLVIVFVLLSNWRLVLHKYAWLALFVSLIAYAPHIAWLAHFDFVTIKYHLSERPNHAYDFAEFTLGYLLNLILVFGLLFFWCYWALFSSLKQKDAFIRAMTFLSLGVIGFFFISSFDRRVQTQWVIVICIPMAVLTYQFLALRMEKLTWFFRVGIASAALLLFARIGLVYEPLFPIIYETHGNKQWTADLKEKSKGLPVVFENSYRRSSMYQFYTGMPAFSMNNIFFRLNQYSIDDSEEKVRHKKVVYTTQYASSGDFTYHHPDSTLFYGRFIADFESFRKLECHVQEVEVDLQSPTIKVNIYNPYSEDIDYSKIKMNLACLNTYKQLLQTLPLKEVDGAQQPFVLKSLDTTTVHYRIPEKQVKDVNFVKFSISENGYPTAINSPSIPIKE